jgi:PTEN phosphatase family protein
VQGARVTTGCRVLAILILAVDVLLVVVQLALKDEFPVFVEELIEVLSLLFSAFFCGEVSLRIVGQGLVFFKRWFEVLDLVVIVASSVLTVLFILLEDHSGVDSSGGGTVVSTARLFVVGRLVRVVFWTKIFYEQKSLQRFIRSKVSQNKRRYTGDGYDLDLTYVTDRVIAMSFPSSGSATFYRNSIREVSQFLDQKHPGHYRVYNLCCEPSPSLCPPSSLPPFLQLRKSMTLVISITRSAGCSSMTTISQN